MEDEIELPAMRDLCLFCHKTFAQRRFLNKHMQTAHKIDTRQHSRFHLCCPIDDCNELFLRYSNLKSHLEECHEIDIGKDIQLTFQSIAEFQKWKSEEEDKSQSHYIKYTATKTFHRGKRSYYVCHRSGNYKSRSLGIRQPRTQGSCKINCTCPSYMNVIETNESTVEVSYQKMHMGHSTDPEANMKDDKSRQKRTRKRKEPATNSQESILEERKKRNRDIKEKTVQTLKSILLRVENIPSDDEIPEELLIEANSMLSKINESCVSEGSNTGPAPSQPEQIETKPQVQIDVCSDKTSELLPQKKQRGSRKATVLVKEEKPEMPSTELKTECVENEIQGHNSGAEELYIHSGFDHTFCKSL